MNTTWHWWLSNRLRVGTGAISLNCLYAPEGLCCLVVSGSDATEITTSQPVHSKRRTAPGPYMNNTRPVYLYGSPEPVVASSENQWPLCPALRHPHVLQRMSLLLTRIVRLSRQLQRSQSIERKQGKTKNSNKGLALGIFSTNHTKSQRQASSA